MCRLCDCGDGGRDDCAHRLALECSPQASVALGLETVGQQASRLLRMEAVDHERGKLVLVEVLKVLRDHGEDAVDRGVGHDVLDHDQSQVVLGVLDDHLDLHGLPRSHPMDDLAQLRCCFRRRGYGLVNL
jgi:hypothetical protein